jgi:hypothetical protein
MRLDRNSLGRFGLIVLSNADQTMPPGFGRPEDPDRLRPSDVILQNVFMISCIGGFGGDIIGREVQMVDLQALAISGSVPVQ